MAPNSDSCGLLDTMKADTGRGGGDGHGAGYTGTNRVLVLPSVPPLPDGRADLWAQSRAQHLSLDLGTSALPQGCHKQLHR